MEKGVVQFVPPLVVSIDEDSVQTKIVQSSTRSSKVDYRCNFSFLNNFFAFYS